MEYFRSSLKNVLGGTENGVQMSGADTIERLVERVLHSTLLDDRRDACRAIKALSRKYRVHVGARGLNALIGILKTDRADCEIIGYALDTLCNVVSPTVFEEEESPVQKDSPALAHESLLHVGEQFTEMFIKDSTNVTLVLDFLEEYDFLVRWPALKFLSSLLTNRCRDIQEIILVSPMGVSKLMDLLSDSREVIRNDALLLLIQLTKSNTSIQKIVAFENAFDRLFDVIAEEGYAEGGIVVEDCLLLMLNLLRNNTSNQNFFKEGSYIRRLCGIFDLRVSQTEDYQWGPQKVSNIHCVLQVIRALVSPSNPGQVTSSCQKSLQSSGVVEALSHLMMSSGVPVDLLTEVICTLGESMRGDLANQEHFSSLLAPSNPPREATVILLMTMINEKQPIILRGAVLYCMQCYLYKNEIGQAKLIRTLLPSSSQVDVGMTSGQVLCSGMLASDPISNWLSSVALSHAVIENPVQKEQLLRVLLAPNPESSPVTLLQQTFLLLQQSCKVQSKVGFLILLSTWLSHCEPAVQMFLAIPSASSHLMSQVASNERDENEELVQGMFAFLLGVCILFNENSERSNLIQLVGKRIGVETFLSKLSEVSKHEQYSKAAKHTQPHAATSSELLLDNEFCKLFRVLEGMIIKAMETESGKDQVVTPSDSEMLLYYKDVIRSQDKKNEELAAENKRLHFERDDLQQKLEELTNSYRQLMDENLILKAQIGTNLRTNRDQQSTESGSVAGELAQYSNENINELSRELALTNLQGNEEIKYHPQTEQFVSMEMERLRKDQEELLLMFAEKQEKLNIFKKRLKELGEQVEDDDDDYSI